MNCHTSIVAVIRDRGKQYIAGYGQISRTLSSAGGDETLGYVCVCAEQKAEAVRRLPALLTTLE